ncbi:MAG: hypothetical protein ACR2JF_13865 [Iamia sp.]
MTTVSHDEVVRVPEAARRAGRTSRDILNHIDSGQLTAHRDAEGMIVIATSALNELRPR